MTGSRQRRSYRAGRLAEDVAALWLRLHGWRIVARRLQTSAVEVDLVAMRGGVLAFVEVKYRPTPDAAVFALSPAAADRLRRAAAAAGPAIARRQRRPDAAIRCDLIALAPFSWPRHLVNIAAHPV